MEIYNPYGFIYITTNNITGKRYIGQKRFHTSPSWTYYLGSGKALLDSIEVYGKENFSRDIVAIAYSEEELNTLEYEWIKNYNAVIDDNYYNLVEGGGTVSGWHHREEDKPKMSIKGERNYFSTHKFYGKDNPFYGKKHSLESRNKMSNSHKGKSPSNRKRILCVTTGKVFESQNSACEYYKITPSILSIALKGNGECKCHNGNILKFKRLDNTEVNK